MNNTVLAALNKIRILESAQLLSEEPPAPYNAAKDSQAASAAMTAPTAPTAPSTQPTAKNDISTLQQALVDAGLELPVYGVDGKMGPETRAAMKAAEMLLGRTPTGNITAAEVGAIKTKNIATSNNSLSNALGAIEAVLAKYKIKTESIEEQIDAYILKNINEYSQQEQLEIWRTLTETDTSDIPAYLRKGTDQFAKPNPDKLGSTVPMATPADLQPKQSKLSKFAGKLGGAKGIGKKIAGRAAASALSGPAALVVGGGLAAWTAYDIGKALYDTFSSTEIGDLDPADQKIITDNLKTVMAYEKDPKMMATLPSELQARVTNVAKGLNSLAVNVGASNTPSAAPAGKSLASTSTADSATYLTQPGD